MYYLTNTFSYLCYATTDFTLTFPHSFKYYAYFMFIKPGFTQTVSLTFLVRSKSNLPKSRVSWIQTRWLSSCQHAETCSNTIQVDDDQCFGTCNPILTRFMTGSRIVKKEQNLQGMNKVVSTNHIQM